MSILSGPARSHKSAVLSQKVDQGRRPRRLRSTRRAGVGRESRRALCWHRPPVLYPRGATRAKLCKCCQGQTPQNFDRVLAAACLYRDMLILRRTTWALFGVLPSDCMQNCIFRSHFGLRCVIRYSTCRNLQRACMKVKN